MAMQQTVDPIEGLSRAFQENLLERRGVAKYARHQKSFSYLGKDHTGELPVRRDDVQGLLRPLYGKGDPEAPSIGDHPDFDSLKGTDDTCHCGITTMFMDIESSTRLSLLFPLEDVQLIKNAFIRMAIDIIKSFDGHVHRIMGDAVMAYFGGRNATAETGIIDGLNCAAVLQLFAERVVIPDLQNDGFKHDFGIRIGLDYGRDEDVLWSSYGYPGMDEVTATSFFVDVAAKLQQSAGRNEVMVGQSLKETIDFPDCLLKTKAVQRDGKTEARPYVSPNHTDKAGNPINYRMYIVDTSEYLLCSPLAQRGESFQLKAGAGTLKIRASLHANEGGPQIQECFASSAALPKGHHIRFQPTFLPDLPYKAVFYVENHGKEAAAADDITHESERYEVNTIEEHEQLVHWEHTKYRGLHYLTVQIFMRGRLDRAVRYGVYLE